jgi:DNA transposition AAA+ family ATPase
VLQTTTPSAAASDAADAAPALDLRDQIRMLMDSDKRLSQARVAKEADMSPTTLSQWLSGIYAGNNDAVEKKLLKWVETTQAARARADVMPASPDYVATPTAEKVIAALRYAQIANDIAVVYGGAGLGKTSGIKQYRRVAPNVWHATMTPASASVVPALGVIAEAVGLTNTSGGAAQLHRAICRRIANAGGLLVIDEAQHLSVSALDQIRSIYDDTEVGIALVGNEQVYARMTGGNRAAYLDRLFSRIGKKVRLIKSTHADIEAILDAWAIEDAKCRPQLIEIASKPGALRGLTKVLRLGSMYAAASNRAMCCDDVRAAWRELGGVE